MMHSVTEWLDATVARFPDKKALIDAKGSLTYREYREKSLAIARVIIEEQKREETQRKRPIVVYLDKGKETLVSFMGVAYSGNFYSPIDVSMPASRVDKIMEVLEPGIVITSEEYRESFTEYNYNGSLIIYDNVISGETDESIVNEISEKIIDTDLLYVLFTSGSTGVPKGVSITHRSVVDYIDWVVETFDIGSEDRFGNQAPFYFDNSVLDIYSCMKTGAELHIIPTALFHQPVLLLQYLRDNDIDTIFWVPSALMVVSKLNALKKVDLKKILRRVLFCGEVMPNKQLNLWRKYLPNTLFANLYGPTEITDVCTFYIVDREFSDEEPLPIGIPTRNTEVMVLNEKNELVAGNEIGELCVRGTCLSCGYYRNPEKTKEVFVQNPLNSAYEEKIYRTGDLVKYNNRGELLYVSRKDYQIKHLGHRIELGEIETAASSLEGVTQCCCVYDEIKQRIILFLDIRIDRLDIRNKLSVLLPEYMIPQKYVELDHFPMNENGKIDRKKLKELI